MKIKNVGAHDCAQRGITLIALIITIVLMLILATVTVNVVIDGGLFEYAGQAKNSTEIASEKETVQKATIIAETTSKTGRITEEEMQKAIDSITDENTATAIEDEEAIFIQFNKSNRYYKVNNKGNIEGPVEIKRDTTPGELDGLGTKEDPFVIMSIEDLVYFSQSVFGPKAYSGQYVELGKTLDFKSKLSYVDYTTTEYDEYLGGDGTTELMTQLCEGGNGFKPIGFKQNSNWSFSGTFDGNGYEIKNIYMGGSFGGGLFHSVLDGTIKNIVVSGRYNSDKHYGGIVYNASESYIYNCCSNIEINGQDVGGICCHILDSKIINCYNIGKISGKWQTWSGGIVGDCKGNNYIYNSYNLAKVEMVNGNAKTKAGGIVAGIETGTTNIINCYNIGEVTSSRNVGSIFAGGGSGEAVVEECYYLEGTATSTVGTEVTKEQMQNEEMIENEYIIDKLNKYVDNYNTENKDATDFIELKRWKIGENGYPAFEENDE